MNLRKENNLIRLVTTYALSRITYAAPYLRLSATDKLKLNTMIKRAYKQALHLPISTSYEKLDALGIHNTIDELIEPQRITYNTNDSPTPPREGTFCAP